MAQLAIDPFLTVAALLVATATSLEAQSRYEPLPRPLVVIGHEGDPAYEFSRLNTALRTPAGLIAVADWPSPSIRIFDSEGRLARTLGRDGAGPGEFRLIQGLFLAHDTLIAYDGPLRRLTRYLPDGTLIETRRVRPTGGGGPVGLTGRLTSGRWIVTTLSAPSWAHGHGVYRDTLQVGTLAASGSGEVEWLARTPGATIFAYMPGGDRSQWRVGYFPLSPSTTAAQLGDTIVVGDTGSPEVMFYDARGRRAGSLILPLDPPGDLRAHRLAARDEAMALERDGRGRAFHTAAAEVDVPALRYRGLVAGTDGLLWIQLIEPRPGDSSRYLVLTPGGSVRARLSLPPRARLLTAQPPWLLVALKDEDDVERVGVVKWR